MGKLLWNRNPSSTSPGCLFNAYEDALIYTACFLAYTPTLHLYGLCPLGNIFIFVSLFKASLILMTRLLCIKALCYQYTSAHNFW